jgi:hypothetical protein
MTQSLGSPRLRHVSLAVGDMSAINIEPSVKARMLRELAAWYRDLAERAANPGYLGGPPADGGRSRCGSKRHRATGQLMIIKIYALSLSSALFMGGAGRKPCLSRSSTAIHLIRANS